MRGAAIQSPQDRLVSTKQYPIDMILYSVLSKSSPKEKFPQSLAPALIPYFFLHLSNQPGWAFEKDHDGKPFAINTKSGCKGFVSITHSRQLLGIAASLTSPVGIDIEHHRQRNFKELAEYAYGKHEQDMVSKEGRSAFYNVWTTREALAKATDADLYDLMDGRDILKPGTGSIHRQGQDFTVRHKTIQAEYSIALVSQRIDGAPPVTREAPIEICKQALHDFLTEHGTGLSVDIAPIQIGPLHPAKA